MSPKVAFSACIVGLLVLGIVALGSVADRPEPGGAECADGSVPSGAATTGAVPSHDHGHSHGEHDQRPGVPAPVSIGPTCNQVEAVGPQDSTYRPDIAAASPVDRSRARSLHRGVNAFCHTSTASRITASWTAGPGTRPTHFFNPDRPGSRGLDPSNPRAVLIYGGEIGGVMFTGSPLPPLGSIPRAHSHDTTPSREMVHVYCADSLEKAFTPSRRLGVRADAIRLGARVRRHLPMLMPPRLGAVLRKVGSYVGTDVPEVDPRSIPTPGGADPVLRARRARIRESLSLLTEQQLRRISTMVR